MKVELPIRTSLSINIEDCYEQALELDQQDLRQFHQQLVLLQTCIEQILDMRSD